MCLHSHQKKQNGSEFGLRSQWSPGKHSEFFFFGRLRDRLCWDFVVGLVTKLRNADHVTIYGQGKGLKMAAQCVCRRKPANKSPGRAPGTKCFSQNPLCPKCIPCLNSGPEKKKQNISIDFTNICMCKLQCTCIFSKVFLYSVFKPPEQTYTYCIFCH